MPEIKSRPCFLTPSRMNPDHPLFVFLPGMDGTGQLLRSQTTGLESGFDIRCLAIPADDLTSWEELTEQVVALVEAEVKKQPNRSVYLCGESFGGCLAMKVALRSPKLFDRMILVNPASSLNQRPWLRLGSQLTHLVPELIYRLGAVWLLPFLAHLERILPSDRQALLDAVRSVPPKTIVWRISLVRDFHMEESKLRSLDLPVLAIAGGADRLLPSVAEAQHLASVLPNAKMLVLPRCGHACLLEADVNLYEIMKAENFLESREKNLANISS
ncbi:MULTISPECIES: alpha/beta fold hydrolase [Cyanophyceae]|uniref:alpha/beta fold hydrolase n=1 Tax=Cyanophyceae TaxID=3028117 RepID=UPI001687241D|nr:alpha/beta fold hydrolase [Trichocoleus sp. FACHB-69]MBD1931207.1 alpha/beta fold hydrolase [Trichocoleus sp. FACHB-69]